MAITRAEAEGQQARISRLPVLHEGRLIMASEAAVARFPQVVDPDIEASGRTGPEIWHHRDRYQAIVVGRDIEQERRAIAELSPAVNELVERVLEDHDRPEAGVREELQQVAATVAPAVIQHIGPDATAQWAWVDGTDTVYAAGHVDDLPIRWVPDPAQAWRDASMKGALFQATPLIEAILVQLSFGAGMLLDPAAITPAPADSGDRLDPITHENWEPIESETAQAAHTKSNGTAVTAQHKPAFVLVGGQAVVVAHDQTHRFDATGTAEQIDPWVLEDRMIESRDWLQHAVGVADAILASTAEGGYGLVWRTDNFAGQAIPAIKAITGCRFRKLSMAHHHDTGRPVTHDIVRPRERWAWVRGYFQAPTRKDTRDSHIGWTAAGSERFTNTPTVLLLTTVETRARMTEMINACRPAFVVATDSPRMRDFARQHSDGGRFTPGSDRVPTLDSYRWKRTERGAITASRFATTWTCGLDLDNPALIDGAMSYLTGVQPPIPLLAALDDPLVVAQVAAAIQPPGELEDDGRATQAMEERLSPYREAWAKRGSCLFYEPKPYGSP